MATKICHICRIEKPLSEFSPYQKRIGKRGKTLRGCCKSCNTNKSTIWRKKNRKRFNELAHKHYHSTKGQNTYYKRVYGISKSEYDVMFQNQKGRCIACGRVQNNRPLSVDHNHKTGKVRGLLCLKCNSTLGFCDESINILLGLIDYIRKTKCQH